MRLTYALASLVLLAACATAPPMAVSSAPNTPSTTRAPSSGLAGLLASAGQSNAPNLAAVERAMGPADIRRQDGAGLALTYRMQTCGLLLLFAPDARNQMRLAETHASARQPNSATPSLEQCADEVRARRAGS